MKDPSPAVPPEGASPGVRSLHALWERARAGRPMPARADIDPVDIGIELLPYVIIADFEPDPFRIRFRLVGTKLVESAGRECTGRCLDEMDWPFVAAATEIYRKVWETGKPAYGSFGAELTIGGWYSIGFAVLPLSASAAADRLAKGAADKCLVVIDYLGLDVSELVRPVLGNAAAGAGKPADL